MPRCTKNASSTGAIRFISLAGAKGLSAIDASAMSQSGIPAQEASASERASLRSIEHPPVAKGPVAIYVGIDWRVFGRHEGIRSCGEVNDLIVWFLGEGLPSVDLAHDDLS